MLNPLPSGQELTKNYLNRDITDENSLTSSENDPSLEEIHEQEDSWVMRTEKKRRGFFYPTLNYSFS